MSDGIDNLGEVVEVITRRVAERLQQMGVLNKIVTTDQDQCVVSDQECVQCGHCVTERPEAIRNILNSGADRIGTKSGIDGNKLDSNLAGMIDHTLLKPDASRELLVKICE